MCHHRHVKFTRGQAAVHSRETLGRASGTFVSAVRSVGSGNDLHVSKAYQIRSCDHEDRVRRADSAAGYCPTEWTSHFVLHHLQAANSPWALGERFCGQRWIERQSCWTVVVVALVCMAGYDVEVGAG